MWVSAKMGEVQEWVTALARTTDIDERNTNDYENNYERITKKYEKKYEGIASAEKKLKE